MKDDGLENEDPGPFSPGAGGKSGLDAGLLEERPASPAILDRDLREEEAAVFAPLDDQAVFSHLDRPGIGDLAERGENRNLDFEGLELTGLDRRKPGVLDGRKDGGLDDGSTEGGRGLDEADAAPELSVLSESDESPSF